MFSVQLEDIFERQSILLKKYRNHDTEEHIDLQLQTAQDDIRQSIIYIVEELAEFFPPMATRPDINELADVTHFLAEMTLLGRAHMAVIEEAEMIATKGGVRTTTADLCRAMLEFLLALGDAIHELKSTYWRKTPRTSDLESFQEKMVLVWNKYVLIYRSIGFTTDKLYQDYIKKNDENHNRINTGY